VRRNVRDRDAGDHRHDCDGEFGRARKPLARNQAQAERLSAATVCMSEACGMVLAVLDGEQLGGTLTGTDSESLFSLEQKLCTNNLYFSCSATFLPE